MRFPPIVIRVRFGSDFCGRTDTTFLVYVGRRPFGISSLRMSVIVSVPVTRPLPCMRRPNSFDAEMCQSAWYFGWLINCLYSKVFHVSASNTPWACGCCCLFADIDLVVGPVMRGGGCCSDGGSHTLACRPTLGAAASKISASCSNALSFSLVRL